MSACLACTIPRLDPQLKKTGHGASTPSSRSASAAGFKMNLRSRRPWNKEWKEEQGGECDPLPPFPGVQKKQRSQGYYEQHGESLTIVPWPVQAIGFTVLRIRRFRLPGAFIKRAKEGREQIGSPRGCFCHLLTRMRVPDPKGMTTGSAPSLLSVLGNSLSSQKEQSVKSNQRRREWTMGALLLTDSPV